MNTARKLRLMTLDPAWFAAIPERASTRTFDGSPISAADLDRLDATCERLRSQMPGTVRAQLVRSVPAGVFTGVFGSYGAVQGAAAFAAFIGRDDAHVDIGYLGEAVVLEATLAGLATCWIAGAFDAARTAKLLDLAEGESVQAVAALGHAAPRRAVPDYLAQKWVRSRSRLPLETIAPGATAWPHWARTAAEAARLAPSGKNDQPWRLRLDGRTLVVARKLDRPYWTAAMDCGIAMLHTELAALHVGMPGRWERLADPDVARFVPDFPA
jgi:hypothetical protein